MVMDVETWHFLATNGAAMQGGYPRPSQLLAALREAEAAHVRCKRLLPTIWVAYLENLRSKAACMEEPLQLMVELQGDSLRTPNSWPAGAAILRRVVAAIARCSVAMQEMDNGPTSLVLLSTCSGCKSVPLTLRKCAACKQAQYCRCARNACLC